MLCADGCAGQDSNLRCLKATELQSAAIAATRPTHRAPSIQSGARPDARGGPVRSWSVRLSAARATQGRRWPYRTLARVGSRDGCIGHGRAECFPASRAVLDAGYVPVGPGRSRPGPTGGCRRVGPGRVIRPDLRRTGVHPAAVGGGAVPVMLSSVEFASISVSGCWPGWSREGFPTAL